MTGAVLVSVPLVALALLGAGAAGRSSVFYAGWGLLVVGCLLPGFLAR